MARRAGFGTVRKLPSGRYQARFWDGTAKAQRTAPHTFASKADANAWLAERQTDERRGTAIDLRRARTPLGDLICDHLDNAPDLKPKTRAGYESLLSSCVNAEDGIGEVPIGTLTADAVRAWDARMARRGLSPSRRRQALRLCAKVTKAAHASGAVGRNPFDAVTMPTMPEPRDRFLERDEVRTLVAAVKPEAYRSLVLVLAFGGLRWGEAVALRRRDVDFERGNIRVSRSLSEATDPDTGKSRQTFETTKTGRSRIVPVPDEVLDALRDHLDTLPLNSNALIWTSRNGTPVRHGNFYRRVWEPACVAAGLADEDADGNAVPNVKPHDLRRTAASLLFAAGATVPEVQAILGHREPTTTLRIYTQVTRGRADSTRDRMNAYLAAD